MKNIEQKIASLRIGKHRIASPTPRVTRVGTFMDQWMDGWMDLHYGSSVVDSNVQLFLSKIHVLV